MNIEQRTEFEQKKNLKLLACSPVKKTVNQLFIP